MKLVGDLTMNHCGVTHEWFERAVAATERAERELFYFDKSLPHGYAAWLGVRTLPKLDWRSQELHDRMRGVLRRWLDAGLDGWRIDVANMIGALPRLRPQSRRRRVRRARSSRGSLLIARARPRLPPRPRRPRLARRDELRRLPAAGVLVAARRPRQRGRLHGRAGAVATAAARW